MPYRRREIVLPVYLADSILTPTEGATLFEHGQRSLDTVVGRFPVPERVDSAEDIGKLADVLYEYVQSDFSTDAFLERMRNELGIAEGSRDEETLRELYEHTLELKRQRKDGIWARVLKNYFMPLFIGEFDYVAGNPPWVNWENLPDGYRQQTARLWERYELFPHKGFDAILGKSKDDISILMTYVALDRFLTGGGKLGFLITQSVFKAVGAGCGFRRFQLPGDVGLRVVHVDDMSELKPFEGASNRTSVMVIEKGRATRYPVPYTYWRKTIRGTGLSYDSSLEQVEAMTTRLHFRAVPVNRRDLTSPWLTARPAALRAIERVLGASDYAGHAGLFSGGANGVYWLEVISRRPDGLLVVRNITEGARREVEPITTELEPDLVCPLLRGRDVQRWRAVPSIHSLLTHEEGQRLRAIPIEEMERRYPKTYAYLKGFERVLRQRAAFNRYFVRSDSSGRVETGPFYSMFDVGDYTFAPYKVVWREQAAGLTCAVVGPEDGKPVIPDHKLMMVECESADEAAYLCAALNSSPARLTVWAYAISIQQDTHIVQHVAVPRFAARNSVHRRLAWLAQEAHDRAGEDVADIEAQIDEAAAELWGITPRELAEIRRNLTELLRTPVAGAEAVTEEAEEALA